MNADRPHTAFRVPTLTEVVARSEPAAVDVRLDEAPPAADVTQGAPPADAEMAPESATDASAPALLQSGAGALRSEAQLVQQVLADVQRQVELMLEYRMRETLAPILARATDTMIRDARSQLANALHEMVARAVAQELSRHRER